MAAVDDDPEAKAREADQEHIRKLLDSPNLHRVFIVTDVIGGDASERVDSLLQQTPRGEPRYGRITVSQGIVIDPKHPDQATVFALVMNEQELRQLREKLEETFPDDFEESIAEPGVVTQLADIGQVAVLSGTAAAARRDDPGRGPAGLAHRGGGQGRRADASLPRRRLRPGLRTILGGGERPPASPKDRADRQGRRRLPRRPSKRRPRRRTPSRPGIRPHRPGTRRLRGDHPRAIAGHRRARALRNAPSRSRCEAGGPSRRVRTSLRSCSSGSRSGSVEGATHPPEERGGRTLEPRGAGG